MTTVRREFSAHDANPAVLYAKDNADAREAYPILRSFFNPGMQVPAHDSILLTYSSGNITHAHYVATSTTVAIIAMTYSSGNLTHVYRL